jgi:hypothetical protein
VKKRPRPPRLPSVLSAAHDAALANATIDKESGRWVLKVWDPARRMWLTSMPLGYYAACRALKQERVRIALYELACFDQDDVEDWLRAQERQGGTRDWRALVRRYLREGRS